ETFPPPLVFCAPIPSISCQSFSVAFTIRSTLPKCSATALLFSHPTPGSSAATRRVNPGLTNSIPVPVMVWKVWKLAWASLCHQFQLARSHAAVTSAELVLWTLTPPCISNVVSQDVNAEYIRRFLPVLASVQRPHLPSSPL